MLTKALFRHKASFISLSKISKLREQIHYHCSSLALTSVQANPSSKMKLALALSCFSLAATAVATASKVALVIGGFGATDSVQVVDQDGGACQGFDSTPGVPRAPDGRIGWVAQHVNGKVVLCGGAKTDFYKDCFEMPMGQGWSPASSMTYAKRYADSLVFNGEMVVLGGYNQNQGWLDAVEKRNGQGQWEEMEAWKMPRKIFDLCAVQMDQDKIMVLGNFTICEN